MTQVFNNKKAIIFDFDGTIADTLKVHDAAFKEALFEYELRFNYYEHLGRSTPDAIKNIFEENGREIDKETIDTITKNKRAVANKLYSTISFMPGAAAFIETAYKKKLQLFIGSSGSEMNIEAGIKCLGISDYFTGVFTAADTSRSKPDPEIFTCILSKYALEPSTVIVIEDAAPGIAAACAAGIDAVSIDKTLQLSETYPCFKGHYLFEELTIMLESE